jgi:hypothetical protein
MAALRALDLPPAKYSNSRWLMGINGSWIENPSKCLTDAMRQSHDDDRPEAAN